MTYPSIVILNGNDRLEDLGSTFQHASSLIACTHPKRRDLFVVIKVRVLPDGWSPKRVLGNVARKTLNRLITANLT